MADAWHRRVLEPRAGLFAALTTVTMAIGGIVEIVPMYTSTIPVMDGVTPYTPLEVAGRDIYVREGCYNCHSQMVRPMRAETLRYGEWTRAGEYMYDRPFQLGSRRIGPDLQRVGGKYPDAWHYQHMRDPRSTTPGSIMPAYTWLYNDNVDPTDALASITALHRLGTPYEVGSTQADLAAQQASISASLAQSGITEAPEREIVAVIAYLQRLGVDGKAALAKVEP